MAASNHRALASRAILIALCLGGQLSSADAAQTIFFYQRGYVAGSTSASTQLTDRAIEAFELRHPEIAVEIIGVPWTKEGDLKQRAALLHRRKIDLFRVTNDQLPAFIPRTGRLLSPVDPWLTEDDLADFSPGALDAVRHGGQIMAWPLWSTAIPLIGNRRIMSERGLEPPAGRPWTWEEFIDIARRATFRREDGVMVHGLTSAARPPLFEWSPLLFAHSGSIFVSGTGGGDASTETETKVEAESDLQFAPGLAEGLARVAQLRDLGVVPPSFGIDDQPAVQKQFREGRAAFILATPGFIRTLSGLQFPYILLPPPTGALGRPITTGALGCFAVVAHSDEPAREAAAHALARYLTSAEIADDVEGWYLATPVRQSVKSFSEDPAYAGLMEIARTAVYMNAPGGAGFVEDTLIPELQAALMGEREPDEALDRIQKAYARRELR